jgi:hypothetical protein
MEERVRRPLGVTFAVLATALWFGIFPLIKLYFLIRLGNVVEDNGMSSGVEITTWNYIETSLGLVILALCVLAWLGRPSWIRYGLVAAIAVPTLITLYQIFHTLSEAVDPIFGGPEEEAWRRVLGCQVPGLLIIPLYVAWYLNRAPSRAFFNQHSHKRPLDIKQ